MSGITILLTRPFEDGDFVEAGDVSGTVKRHRPDLYAAVHAG
ncbi:MAG: mechanosensitive ion channel domain-containing protein [Oscillospiraceae bacterium]